MTQVKGIKDLRIHDTPIAIVGLETTGLSPGRDRIIEISVVRVEPGRESYLAFDTLVNPQRNVAFNEIHGITDDEVANAPVFADIAGDFLESVSGCVLAAYDVYFDIKFLTYELEQVGIKHPLPHFSLIYIRPLLELGSRCNLEAACKEYNIDYQTARIAANRTRASGKLMEFYLQVMSEKKIYTFGQLSRLKYHEFFQSFENVPLPAPSAFNLKPCHRLLSRVQESSHSPVDPKKHAIHQYWNGLRNVIADLEITDQEQAGMIEIRSKYQIPKEQIRMLHARVFASVIEQFIDDKWLDDKEAAKLRRLSQCLSKLGWSPGE
ncbi:MAG: 3'-5' exonuclease [Sedimentisphaerales bacterium]|nr:3'-5' exonuclease [Sedimentisphaerales bacterium]